MSASHLESAKIAIVYDHLCTAYGGAEHILQSLHELYPSATVYTLLHNKKETPWSTAWNVKTTFLQKVPFASKLHRFFGIFAPVAFETLDLTAFEIIISVTSGPAKGVLTLPHQLHICYLLTPTRYLFSHQQEYLHKHRFFSFPVVKPFTKIVMKYLAWWDSVAAFRPDMIVPISSLVRDRSLQYYQRKVDEPLYPPLPNEEVPQLKAKKLPYFLTLSRLVQYKRIDLAIQASEKNNAVLIVGGNGPERSSLIKVATNPVIRKEDTNLIEFLSLNHPPKSTLFLGTVTPQEKKYLLSAAQVLIMPGLEDFGITAMEAALHGTPVILHSKSGAAELLRDKKEAVHILHETVEDVYAALQDVKQREFSSTALQLRAQHFLKAQFQNTFSHMIQDKWNTFEKTQHLKL